MLDKLKQTSYIQPPAVQMLSTSVMTLLTCLWSYCLFLWSAADHAMMGEVSPATVVTRLWLGVMWQQLWRSALWQRTRRLLFHVATLLAWVLCAVRLGCETNLQLCNHALAVPDCQNRNNGRGVNQRIAFSSDHGSVCHPYSRLEVQA